jgi:Na+/melibiose symporter-like transporter
MDAVGVVLLGTGLIAGMLAASALGERDTEIWSAAFIACLAVSIIALSAFVRHIGRVGQPLIMPRFIHGPGFSTVNLFNILYGGITNGAMALVPLYATDRYGIGALAAGSLLIAQGGAAIVLSIAATFALRRTGYRLPLYVGGGFMVLGALLLAVSPPAGITPYLWLTGGAFLIGVGSGIASPASRNAGLKLAPESSATLAALRSMGRQIGAMIAVSIATAIIAGSADPGGAQAWVYASVAALLIAAMPLVAHVPEHRGAW